MSGALNPLLFCKYQFLPTGIQQRCILKQAIVTRKPCGAVVCAEIVCTTRSKLMFQTRCTLKFKFSQTELKQLIQFEIDEPVGFVSNAGTMSDEIYDPQTQLV